MSDHKEISRELLLVAKELVSAAGSQRALEKVI